MPRSVIKCHPVHGALNSHGFDIAIAIAIAIGGGPSSRGSGLVMSRSMSCVVLAGGAKEEEGEGHLSRHLT